jgi:hypothetical protein
MDSETISCNERLVMDAQELSLMEPYNGECVPVLQEPTSGWIEPRDSQVP